MTKLFDIAQNWLNQDPDAENSRRINRTFNGGEKWR